MTYEAKLTVKFDSKFTPSLYSSYETDSLPEEHITFEIPVDDLTTTQIFGLFKKVMLTMGYREQSIASGVMSTVFNPDGDEKLMRKICEEYDLTMNEDVGEDTPGSYRKLYQENLHLKAKLSRLENPDAPQYTDEEIEAMCSEETGMD